SNPCGDFLPEFSFLESLNSADAVVGLSGEPLWLRPPRTQTNASSARWKVQLLSKTDFNVILSWNNHSNSLDWTSNNSTKRFNFTTEDLTLIIKAAQQQDSGLYLLEVTVSSGKVWTSQFQVSVFDHVEKPYLQGKLTALERGMCQAVLNCSVSSGGNVSYAWYRGSELIPTSRNVTYLEEETDVNGSHVYTCNVSNPISWAHDTLNFTRGCSSAHQKFVFLPYLVITMILLITLFLGTLTCFCVRKRKRKQSQTSSGEYLTIYEDVNNLQIRRNQEQWQNPPGKGSTVYSMIQSRSSASTSQETANTLYALIQPSQKSGSKKRNHSPPFSSTIYEEVGKRQLKAQNPARLSRKELENFCIYS
ncbi:hypothetical protein HPG69_003910, partial [Diceros bicornis minor]